MGTGLTFGWSLPFRVSQDIIPPAGPHDQPCWSRETFPSWDLTMSLSGSHTRCGSPLPWKQSPVPQLSCVPLLPPPDPAAPTSRAALASSCLGPLNLWLKTINLSSQTRMPFSSSSKARPQRSLLQAALLIAPGIVLAPAGGIPISIPDHVSLTPPGWWLPWGQAGTEYLSGSG